MENTTVILASSSPRRQELMKKVGLPFRCEESGYEEDLSLPLEPEQLVEHLAHGKAEQVFRRYRHGVVLGADTVVAHGSQVLGKPLTAERATEMLSEISGSMVRVITGVALITPEFQKTYSVTVGVQIKPLTEKDIEDYVMTGEPLDKAGAFAVQGKGGRLVERIDGDLDSVIGLPVEKVREMLSSL